jgi:hypothetical protein
MEYTWYIPTIYLIGVPDATAPRPEAAVFKFSEPASGSDSPAAAPGRKFQVPAARPGLAPGGHGLFQV